MIKGLIKLFIVAAFIFICGWLFVFSYVKLENDTFAVLEKRDSGEARSLHFQPHNFIIHGALKDDYEIKIYPAVFSHRADVLIPIPPVTDLTEERYSVSFSATIRLRIDSESNSGLRFYSSSADPLKRFASSMLAEVAGIVFSEYLDNGYRREALRFNTDEIMNKINSMLSDRVQKNGLSLEGAEFSAVKIPPYEIYNEGIKYQNELRNEMIRNEREKIAVKGSLDREKLESESRLSYYGDVAKLIKSNPDLLKYIYIDKIAGNVRVVISSDKELVPEIFTHKPDTVRNKEIDNLK